MKAVTRNQSNEIGARVLRNTDWGQIDGSILQKEIIEMSEVEFGRRFTHFLKCGARIDMENKEGVLIVDRSKPFDPVKLFGDGWTIWRGPRNGDGLSGEEAQDLRSLRLSEIDLSKLIFENLFQGIGMGLEDKVEGEVKLVRLRKCKNHISLDAQVGQRLLNEKNRTSLRWIVQTFGITGFELPGTTMRSPQGKRYFLWIYRENSGQWIYKHHWLGYNRNEECPFALLAE